MLDEKATRGVFSVPFPPAPLLRVTLSGLHANTDCDSARAIVVHSLDGCFLPSLGTSVPCFFCQTQTTTEWLCVMGRTRKESKSNPGDDKNMLSVLISRVCQDKSLNGEGAYALGLICTDDEFLTSNTRD